MAWVDEDFKERGTFIWSGTKTFSCLILFWLRGEKLNFPTSLLKCWSLPQRAVRTLRCRVDPVRSTERALTFKLRLYVQIWELTLIQVQVSDRTGQQEPAESAQQMMNNCWKRSTVIKRQSQQTANHRASHKRCAEAEDYSHSTGRGYIFVFWFWVSFGCIQ